MMFCNANRNIDPSDMGPLREFMHRRCGKTATRDEVLARGVE